DGIATDIELLAQVEFGGHEITHLVPTRADIVHQGLCQQQIPRLTGRSHERGMCLHITLFSRRACSHAASLPSVLSTSSVCSPSFGARTLGSSSPVQRMGQAMVLMVPRFSCSDSTISPCECTKGLSRA